MRIHERKRKKVAQPSNSPEQLIARRQMLDLLAIGVIAVNAEADVLFANEEAIAIVSMNDGLSIVHGQLMLTRGENMLEFLSILRDAYGESIGRAFLVRRPSGRRGYQCIIHLLDSEPRHPQSKNAIAVILLTDPERIDDCQVHFASLYGLTPQEAHLAEHMARGESLKLASEKMRVRKSTARTHLKHLMQKVGAKRQGELVSVLLKTPPVRHSGRAVRH